MGTSSGRIAPRRSGLVLALGALVLGLQASAGTAPGREDCSGKWEVFSNRPYEQLAYPDTSVWYWRYRFELEYPTRTVLRIRGTFPEARYMNFQVYLSSTMDSTGSLTDFQIEPDPGSVNPFRPATRGRTGPRGYTVRIVPPGSVAKANTLAYPSAKEEGRQQVEVWYRVYKPSAKALALVVEPQSLPRIEAVDAETGEPLTCPLATAEKSASPPVHLAIKNVSKLPAWQDGEGAPTRFHVFDQGQAAALYANQDNYYSAARLGAGADEVTFVRFLAPRVPATFGARAAGIDVRYWSLCIGGTNPDKQKFPWPWNVGQYTQTSACMGDQDGNLPVSPESGNAAYGVAARLDADGYVNAVIGPKDLASAVVQRGWNFLENGELVNPGRVVIYRSLLPAKGFDLKGNWRPSGCRYSHAAFLRRLEDPTLTASALCPREAR